MSVPPEVQRAIDALGEAEFEIDPPDAEYFWPEPKGFQSGFRPVALAINVNDWQAVDQAAAVELCLGIAGDLAAKWNAISRTAEGEITRFFREAVEPNLEAGVRGDLGLKPDETVPDDVILHEVGQGILQIVCEDLGHAWDVAIVLAYEASFADEDGVEIPLSPAGDVLTDEELEAGDSDEPSGG